MGGLPDWPAAADGAPDGIELAFAELFSCSPCALAALPCCLGPTLFLEGIGSIGDLVLAGDVLRAGALCCLSCAVKHCYKAV